MMIEPITTPLLTQMMDKLHAAFPRTIGKDNPAMMAGIYRDGLKGVSGEGLRHAVDRCIQLDQYYPKVARLREFARDFDKQRIIETRRPPSWDECPTCGARVTFTDVYFDTAERDAEGKVVQQFAGRKMHMTHRPVGHGIPEQVEQ